MAIPNAVTLRGVSKHYGGTRALEGLDLDVPEGTICGVVGPNGAGKTTTFGVIAGLIRADAGTIDLLGGGPFHPRRHAGRITLLPQDCALNPHLSVAQLLHYYGQLQGLDRSTARHEVDRVLDLVELRERASSRITQLSHGMRRRVQVAQALLGSPELVLLDEPTSGLDPELVVRMRAVFQGQGRQSTVVLSSHILSELEATCDHVIFMGEGRAVQSGPVSEITGVREIMRIRLDRAPPLEALQALEVGNEFRWDGEALLIELRNGIGPEEINRHVLPLLLDAGVGILDIQLGRSLEDSYLASIT